MIQRWIPVLLAGVVLVVSACGGNGDQAVGTDADPSSAAEPPCSAEEPATSTPLPPSLVGAEWFRIPTEEKVVALTFDCGANAAGVASILSTLEEANAPATFFLTGRWAKAFPDDAEEIGTSYPVGNHTYSHPKLTALEPEAVRAQLLRAEGVISRVAGQDPRPLFRFPYGARNAGTIELVNELGYGSIAWTVDTLGWRGAAGGQSTRSVLRRVIAALRPGAIVLMHVGSAPDGTTLDADALPKLIAAIRARGYELVSLDRFVR